ncbi:hypothetical protein JB92DRAFT_3139788 [Gautieria morchelliformis]|nr:hypothetical protein JB92DRAFT_3139788 [Gautieria morchelliformis]
MISLLESASPFLLLLPAFLSLLFFARGRLVGSPSCVNPTPVICTLVCFLGPLAAVPAVLGLASLALNLQSQSIKVAQDVIQSFVEFGYRASILYLTTPRSFGVLATRILLSQKETCRHSTIFALVLFATFILSVIQGTLAPSIIPTPLPFALAIVAALFPIPLIIHLILSAQSARVRRIWAFICLLQIFSALAMALRIPQAPEYALCSALFTALWGGGIITLFYTLSSSIPPSSSSQSPRPPKSSLLSFISSTVTQVRVQYETPPTRQFSGALTSEDFTALRDPFASPPPVSPVSIITPVPRLPSASPASTPHTVLNPPPIPVCKVHKPPRPKAKEIKPQRRGITKQASSLGISTRASSQSLQSISGEMPHEGNRHASGSGSEGASLLCDEAFLSQILLHSLIRDATPSSSPPRLSERCDEAGSVYSEPSITAIRIRRDENGRRYGSEEARYSDSAMQEIEETKLQVHRDDLGRAQSVLTSQEGNEEDDNIELQSSDLQVDTALWGRR